jgi:hypothetical protein
MFFPLAIEAGFAAMLAVAQTPAPAPRQSAPAAKPGVSNTASQVDSIIKLVKAGLSEGLIVKSLQKANKPANLSTADMVKLKEAGVSENIILVMMDPTFVPEPVAAPAAAGDPAPPPPPPPAPGQAAHVAPVAPPAAAAVNRTAVTGDWKAAIQSRLEQQFPLTQASGNKADIVSAGAVLTLKKSALAMYTAAAFSNVNTYKNGKISNGMFGSLCKTSHESNSCKMFVKGEKFWVIQIDVKDDGATFRFLSDPMPDSRFMGALKFPFAKGSAPSPDEIAALASEVVGVDTSVTQAPPAPTGQAPPAPQQTVQPAQQSFAEIPPPPPPLDQAAPAPIPPPAAPTGNIDLGQTIDQVVAAMGQPDRIATVGAKKIYSYKNLKVTFINGKVTDVQ